MGKDNSYEKKLQKLRELRPMDDEFMRCLFKDNIPLAQLVLRIITGKDDLEIVECRAQEDMKRLAGARSICLDAYGTDSYTIFITEKDFYSKEEAVYLIERVNLMTGEPFGDGEHILYVNGEYREDSDIGKLMYDFNCTKADDMNFELLAERTRYLKENPKGVSEVSGIVEELCNEAEYFRAIEIAKRMIMRGKATLEEIAEDTGLTLDKVQELAVTKQM